MKNRVLLSAAALLALAASAADARNVMYRYTTPDGSRVFSYTLPPGQARLGYEKVDIATGRVESVAPQLSPEELARAERQQQALAECRQELQRLSTLYSVDGDIDRAEAAALEALHKRTGQLNVSAELAAAQLERMEAQAANAERAGRPVPEDLMKRMDSSRRQIDELHRQVAEQSQQREQVEQRYRLEREQFRQGACAEPGTDVAGR
jgi:hypothetical protein